MKYEYHINKDERGEFNADVRHPETEQSIYEIEDAARMEELYEDGFMLGVNDFKGLEGYLKSFNLLKADDSIVSAYEV